MNKYASAFLFVIFFSYPVFAQKPHYEVFALKFADVGKPLPLAYMVLNGPEKETFNAIFMIWLIKGDNGKNILVDAGFISDVAEAKEFTPAKYMRPDSVVSKAGVDPKSITDIIISHPHWDHIDGVSLFPNAHIWIQKDDYGYFVGGAWQKSELSGGFNPRDVLMMVNANMAGRVTLVDGDDKEIIPGIKVYTGSRHTFNSEYVLVDSGTEKIIIASDNAYTYYNIERLISAPMDATYNAEGYVAGIKRMKTLVRNPKYIIPGHDGAVFERFPKINERTAKII